VPGSVGCPQTACRCTDGKSHHTDDNGIPSTQWLTFTIERKRM
jgi:hypothetical protein